MAHSDGAISLINENLLFLSPTTPAFGGHGTAMRAGMMLKALSKRFNIFLLVLHIYPERKHSYEFVEISKYCKHIAVYSTTQLVTAADIIRALNTFDAVEFSAVHVFRLSMVRFAASFLYRSHRPKCVLDIDDFESKAAMRLAETYLLTNSRAFAYQQLRLADTLRGLESECLREFDRVIVANPLDVNDVEAAYSISPAVVPNAVQLLSSNVIPKSSKDFCLLFVGTMNYPPNDDAAMFFCSDILPIIASRGTRPYKVVLAGGNPSERLQELARSCKVEVVGYVRDLVPLYREADLVIAPLRSGGGTRLKILEACSHSKAVISTAVGAEGLTAVPGEHLLIADSPEEFASACVRLMRNDIERQRISRNAHKWVSEHHSDRSVERALASVYGGMWEGERNPPTSQSPSVSALPVRSSSSAHNVVPTITAVVCTFKRPEDAARAIQSLLLQSLPKHLYSIVVVNNAPEERERLLACLSAVPGASCVKVLEERQVGLSAARNRALSSVNSEYIAFLDDDAYADPTWLESLLAGFRHPNHRARVVGGKVLAEWEETRPSWLPDTLLGYLSLVDHGESMVTCHSLLWLAGTNICFSRAVLVQIGGFRTDLGRRGYALVGNEELEACRAISEHGFEVVYTPLAVVRHKIRRHRVTQRWFRRRVFWQAVSDLMASPEAPLHESPTPEPSGRHAIDLSWLEVEAEDASHFERHISDIRSLVRTLAQ